MKIFETPIDQIEDIYAYFQDPSHMPLIQVASDKTHYVWQHFSNHFHTVQVLRDGPIHELPERPDPAIGGISVLFADGTVKTVDDYFDTSTMDAMVVLCEGNVVYERYKTMRPFDKHIWFSCSKSIEGTLLAMLEHEGKVDVSKPVTHYMPELAGSAWDTVTVEETADMATGLDSTEHEVPDARTNPAQGWYQWAVSIGLFEDTKKLNETPIDVLKRMKREKPGHTVFEYNSINTYVCQTIVEKVSGVPLAELFGERFWRRIGAQGDGYIVMNKQGHALGFGFMNSTLRDLGRYGMAFTPSQKKLSKDPIVPEAVMQEFHTGLRPEIYGKGIYGSDLQKDFPALPTATSGISSPRMVTSSNPAWGVRGCMFQLRRIPWSPSSAPVLRGTKRWARGWRATSRRLSASPKQYRRRGGFEPADSSRGTLPRFSNESGYGQWLFSGTEKVIMIASLSLASLLVAITTVIHLAGISLVALLIKKHADHWRHRHPFIRAQKVGRVVVLMFFLSFVEISVWAGVYLLVGAFEKMETALYFSMVTFTTLGYGDVVLDERWRLMAAFEAANGIIIFGLTTAVVIAVVQRVYFADTSDN